MITRSIRVVAFLTPLLVIATQASLASSEPTNAAFKTPHVAAFCPADPAVAPRRTDRPSTHNRIAFKCRCCGRDDNGHCNHQCCD